MPIFATYSTISFSVAAGEYKYLITHASRFKIKPKRATSSITCRRKLTTHASRNMNLYKKQHIKRSKGQDRPRFMHDTRESVANFAIALNMLNDNERYIFVN